MSEVTRILEAIGSGDTGALERLLPLVYDELRRLAAAKLAHEAPGQTLQATALVHEAYLRLVGTDDAPQWNGRRHFFAAATGLVHRDQRGTRHSRRSRVGVVRRRADRARARWLRPAASGRSSVGGGAIPKTSD